MKRGKRMNATVPMPQKGEKISVRYHNAVVAARVRKVHGQRIVWKALYTGTPPNKFSPQRMGGILRRREFGVFWVRGHYGEAADAFASMVALTPVQL